MHPLLVVATPLGNLSDVSPRVRQSLAEADVIAAEDTRVTRKLLAALDIPSPNLVSYWGRDEEQKARGLVQRIEAGEKVVLVCDAGNGCAWMFTQWGEPVYRIRACTPGRTVTNLCYGGPDNKRLFITESETGTILQVDMDLPGQPLYSHM